jgi:hypothetical protein
MTVSLTCDISISPSSPGIGVILCRFNDSPLIESSVP